MVLNPDTLICHDQKHIMEILHEYKVACIIKLFPDKIHRLFHYFTNSHASHSPFLLTQFSIASVASYVNSFAVFIVFHRFIYNFLQCEVI